MSLFDKRYHEPGTPPGTLTAHAHAGGATSRWHRFNSAQCTSGEGSLPAEDFDGISWLHIQGQLTDVEAHDLVSSHSLPILAMEDALNVGQRAKVECWDDMVFVILSLPEDGESIQVRQVSLFLTKDGVVSLCEGDADPFQPLVKALESNARLRNAGADYLLYRLLDLVIDHAFPVLEQMADTIEALEERVLNQASEARERGEIHVLRRELLLLRRNLWPQREVLNVLLRDSELITPATREFLRDCYDHAIQVMELVEVYREMVASLLELWVSAQSFRMNETMRVLTVIATIFIPITFVVGVYGMNFDRAAGGWNMPELEWRYGYLFVWGLIVVMVSVMALYFRRRKWL